jgi:hypothetical protein
MNTHGMRRFTCTHAMPVRVCVCVYVCMCEFCMLYMHHTHCMCITHTIYASRAVLGIEAHLAPTCVLICPTCVLICPTCVLICPTCVLICRTRPNMLHTCPNAARTRCTCRIETNMSRMRPNMPTCVLICPDMFHAARTRCTCRIETHSSPGSSRSRSAAMPKLSCSLLSGLVLGFRV